MRIQRQDTIMSLFNLVFHFWFGLTICFAFVCKFCVRERVTRSVPFFLEKKKKTLFELSLYILWKKTWYGYAFSLIFCAFYSLISRSRPWHRSSENKSSSIVEPGMFYNKSNKFISFLNIFLFAVGDVDVLIFSFPFLNCSDD